MLHCLRGDGSPCIIILEKGLKPEYNSIEQSQLIHSSLLMAKVSLPWLSRASVVGHWPYFWVRTRSLIGHAHLGTIARPISGWRESLIAAKATCHSLIAFSLL